MASEDLPANGHGGPADLPAKPALRRAFRAARSAYVAALSPGERAALQAALAARLADRLPVGTTAAYIAVGDEIDVIVDRPLAYPRVVRGQRLTFHAGDRAACQPGVLGIPEPPAGAAVVDPDIVIVPLLAVDRRGFRLGYGGGYYDRTLAALRRRPVLAIGVAWDMQVVDALPADAWDERLDAVATPSQWLTFGGAAPMSRR